MSNPKRNVERKLFSSTRRDAHREWGRVTPVYSARQIRPRRADRAELLTGRSFPACLPSWLRRTPTGVLGLWEHERNSRALKLLQTRYLRWRPSSFATMRSSVRSRHSRSLRLLTLLMVLRRARISGTSRKVRHMLSGKPSASPFGCAPDQNCPC